MNAEKVRMSPVQYQKQIDIERQLNHLLLEIDKMEECDIDCQEFRAKIGAKIQQSIKLRENFGPTSKLG